MMSKILVIGEHREKKQEEQRFQPLFGDTSKQLKARLRILSKKYTWEIIADLLEGKKNLTQIAEHVKIPYTTVQNRVVEMEKLKLLTIHDEVNPQTRRPVKMIRVEDFRIEITGGKIRDLVKVERG